MKRLSILIVYILIAFSNFCQAATNANENLEIGIVEHLDNVIPLDLKFSNEANKEVILKDLINKPTLLSFVYFDCPGMCSPLLDGVSTVIEKADLELGKDYQVITVSFNYNDTPEKASEKKHTFLRRHSKNHAADWIFLTGDSTSIYSLSNAVGFKFKRSGVDFIHPSAIMMISPQGKITRYLYGINFLPFDLKMAVVEAQKGLSRPTINKVMDFCFAYDPAGKRYALDITKIAGVIMVFILLLFAGILLFRGIKLKKKMGKNLPQNI